MVTLHNIARQNARVGLSGWHKSLLPEGRYRPMMAPVYFQRFAIKMEAPELANYKPLLENPVDEVHDFETSTYTKESLLPEPLSPGFFFTSHIDYEYDQIRSASDGGSFAVIHKSDESMMHSIVIYDSMLNKVREISGDRKTGIKDFYLTPEEMLAVLYESSLICVYDQRGNLIISKTVCSDQMVFIVVSSFYDSGLFFATYDGHVYHVTDFSKLSVEEFPNCSEFSNYMTYGIAVPPIEGQHGACLWLHANYNGKLLICVQESGIQTVDFQDDIKLISFSADYQMAMVLCSDSMVICSPTFSEAYVRLNFSEIAIRDAVWCGSSSVLLTTATKLVMVGDSSNFLTWDMPGGCFVKTEIDGARIVTKNDVLLIREVSGVPLDFIKKKKDSPTLKFFTAVGERRKFAVGDPIADMAEILPEALDGCLYAAKFFRKAALVRTLLGAVSRYKRNVEKYDCTQYSHIITNVRIVCNLAEYPLNMPITDAQLTHLGYPRLLLRLCNRYQHLYASRICEYVGERNEVILTHWAHCLVRSHGTIEEILSKLASSTNVDYVELATCAFDLAEAETDLEASEQRRQLALALLKKNKVQSRSVPLLIRRNQWAEAVESAVNSNDSSLILYVLKTATERCQDDIVKQCITNHVLALEAWLKLHPDEPNKAELLEKTGLLRDSLYLRFKNGEDLNVLKEKAKAEKDPLDLDVFERKQSVLEACKSLGVEFSEGITPNSLMDMAIERGDAKLVKTVAKQLKLGSDEILNRKMEYSLKTGDAQFLLDAAREAKERDVLDVVMRLAETGHEQEARMLSELVKSEELVEELQENLDRAIQLAHA